MLLEICAYNMRSCRAAESAGAGRIELCADPGAGGVTPSWGLIQFALEQIAIPVFPMIRPRGGNFIYDADELAIMKKDILKCRELGCKGIATGVQLADHKIDTDTLARLVEWAGPMEVTCHKVFDRAPDALEALNAVMKAGCKRILTSGLAPTAVEGAEVIKMLTAAAGPHLKIMAGGGVRSANITALVADAGAHEYHTSAIVANDGQYLSDENEIRTIVNYLNA